MRFFYNYEWSDTHEFDKKNNLDCDAFDALRMYKRKNKGE